ncbi:hypothetical protein C0J52_18358, partial [Blattella germanica]
GPRNKPTSARFFIIPVTANTDEFRSSFVHDDHEIRDVTIPPSSITKSSHGCKQLLYYMEASQPRPHSEHSFPPHGEAFVRHPLYVTIPQNEATLHQRNVGCNVATVDDESSDSGHTQKSGRINIPRAAEPTTVETTRTKRRP